MKRDNSLISSLVNVMYFMQQRALEKSHAVHIRVDNGRHDNDDIFIGPKTKQQVPISSSKERRKISRSVWEEGPRTELPLTAGITNLDRSLEVITSVSFAKQIQCGLFSNDHLEF